MTTYPLSELATIYTGKKLDDGAGEVVGRGTLEDCAVIVAGLSDDSQRSIFITMDDLAITFGPQEISDLLRFLREESPGLSNAEITDVKTAHM